MTVRRATTTTRASKANDAVTTDATSEVKRPVAETLESVEPKKVQSKPEDSPAKHFVSRRVWPD